MLRSVDPSTGQVVREFTPMSNEVVDAAIAGAAEQQESWGRTPIPHRRDVVLRLADSLENRKSELATTMAVEMGKPIAEGEAEIGKCAWVCRHYADNAEEMLAGRRIETERSQSFVTYQPLGVVLAIMPWNFPFWQVFRFLAPALMAGNGALLKHASNVTGCALEIEQMVHAAGVPADLFHTLVIPSHDVGRVIANKHIAAVTLTGSDAAGRAVASAAGAALKKTVLELGGSDAYVVFEDADLDLTVEACATSRLINGGQSCIAAKRFIVHTSIASEFTSRLVEAMSGQVMGDPTDPSTTLGPMARRELRDELHYQVRASIDMGAHLVVGGVIPEGPGAFYPPTVLTDVAADMPVWAEETFGPVATITEFHTEGEAVFLANLSPFGLGAAVFTQDISRGLRIATEELQAGSAFVNAFVASDPRLPFGGIKASGWGRELSHEGILEFVNTKTIVVD